MRQTTLGFIIQNWKILLAMKKRGFWEWKYNWFWWKLELWETVDQAMIREANEEIWINILEQEKIWVLNFYFEENKDWNQSVNVFFIHKFSWEIEESEEMKPYWFELNKIPYDEMWEDDKIWLPEVLWWKKGIEYDFFFDKNWKLSSYKKIK